MIIYPPRRRRRKKRKSQSNDGMGNKYFRAQTIANLERQKIIKDSNTEIITK